MSVEQEQNKSIREMLESVIDRADAKQISREEEITYLEDLCVKSCQFYRNNLRYNLYLMIDSMNLEESKGSEEKSDIEKGIALGKLHMGEVIKEYLQNH